MESSSNVVPVLSLVPSSSLANLNSVNRKYWHIICKYLTPNLELI
jgi:hypothetical protein